MSSGGQIVVKALYAHKVDTVFCVAGESYLPVLDALIDYPDIKVITCRHESGAAFMAEAYANLTGKTGVALVTRAPGACNASIGIHNARQSSAPVLLLVGLIHSQDKGKEAFQEFDLPQTFGPLAKWAAVIERPQDISVMMTQAFHMACSDRPGPVVLGLPEDVLCAEAGDTEIESLGVSRSTLSRRDIKKTAKLLRKAKQPVIIGGGGGWADESCAALRSFAEKYHVPVAASFRRQDIFNNRSACYIGELGFGPNPALVERVKSADVVLVLGARISDVLTQGYTLFQKSQKIIHVYPSKEAFGKAYKPALAVKAHPGPVIDALAGVKLDDGKWTRWRKEARKDYLAWTESVSAVSAWSGADMTQVFGILRDLLPEDAIITTDAGNFSGWCNRYLRYGRPGRQLGPLSGAMGYAVPSAVAAAIAEPGRLVLGVCGDGGFMMTGQEIATATHHGAAPIIMICNNSMYGTIRMHQERDFPGRPVATALTNPDFVKLGESYGAFATQVTHAGDFEYVWKKAVQSRRPAVIEIVMDPRQISTTSKL